MPADMTAVETQMKDVPLDTKVPVDSEGDACDFGSGMNWQGVIRDERTAKYCVKWVYKIEFYRSCGLRGPNAENRSGGLTKLD